MIWMAVSADKYELPFAVAESAPELARLLGIKTQTVRIKQWKDCKHGDGYVSSSKQPEYKIVKVEE